MKATNVVKLQCLRILENICVVPLID
jgi:hypothetical protein